MWPVMIYSGIVFTALPAWAHVWFPGPAVYVLCRRALDGRVTLLHIGETEDVADGIGAGHPIWDEAITLGLSEIHIHLLAASDARRTLAGRLRRRYPTPLDREHPVHRDIARLADALASQAPRAITVFDWIEAMVVARPPAAAHEPRRDRPAPVLMPAAERAVSRGHR